MALLDRAQPGGISPNWLRNVFDHCWRNHSRAIFITWLSKSRKRRYIGMLPRGESNNAVFGMVVAFSFFLFLVGGSVLYNFWQRRAEEQQQAFGTTHRRKLYRYSERDSRRLTKATAGHEQG